MHHANPKYSLLMW